jgi:menaquinone-9 beta-reductase
VRRHEFDRALAAAAVERGAVLVEDSLVERVEVGTDQVEVRTADRSYTARAAVGADGVGSRVRRELGLPFGTYKAAAIEADTPVQKDDPTDLLRFDFSDRAISGYAWDFPTPVGGGVQISRGMYLLSDPRQLEPRFEARLRGSGIDPATLETKRLVERGFELHRPYARPRVLLAGESAGIDPFNGEGIAPAILYGALAAQYLDHKLERDDLRFDDWGRRVRLSTLGLELFLSRLLVPLFYGALRPPLEAAFRKLPRVLWLITGMFAGRIWSHRDLIR